MRKLFHSRRRLVVYLEADDLARLEQHARGQGRTMVEWAREILLGQLVHRDLPKAKVVWPIEAPAHIPIVSGTERCPHGVYVYTGDLCYRCDLRTGKPRVST